MGNVGKAAGSVAWAIPSGLGSYFVQRALGAWGKLDAPADAVGKYLKVNGGAMGRTISAALFLVLWGLGLWLIWRTGKSGGGNRSGGVPITQHPAPVPRINIGAIEELTVRRNKARGPDPFLGVSKAGKITIEDNDLES